MYAPAIWYAAWYAAGVLGSFRTSIYRGVSTCFTLGWGGGPEIFLRRMPDAVLMFATIR